MNISRRTFIKLNIPLWISVLSGGITIGDWCVKELAVKPVIPKGAMDAAKSLFYLNRERLSIVPASNNPNVRERLIALREDTKISSYDDLFKHFSRATVQASDTFKPFLFSHVGKGELDHIIGYEQVDRVIGADLNHVMVALGTPTSNYLVRDKMFYKELPNPKNGHVHRESSEEYIRFPYKFELSKKNILENGNPADLWYRSRNNKGEVSNDFIPNWGYISPKGNLVLPATDNGLLLEDFLVISVIPNFTTPDNVEREVPVVCMGGTHAVGTLAIKNLFESENCLPDLLGAWTRKGSPRFWQAVFKVQLCHNLINVVDLHLIGIETVDVHAGNLISYAERISRSS